MSEEGFRPVIKSIRKWDKDIRTQLRKELRGAGNMIADGARILASEHSGKIAGTIKVRTRIQTQKAEVEIKAGSADVPEAGLFELGNKGGSKSQAATRRGEFRHPVFGDRENWVNQAMHPFLAPTVKMKLPAATKRIEAAVDGANETIGGF